MSGHRWSGWPGAWCLDCGMPDPIEQALADDDPRIEWDEEGNPGKVNIEVPPCPEPGSRRHDPYAALEGDRN